MNHCAAGNNCPKGWTQLDCFCYIYEDERRTFADAESVCNILGGNLVSIHSDLENALLFELFKAGPSAGAMWIGLTDAVLEDDFMWTDGSNVDFTNFSGGEAGDDDGDCVAMVTDTGEWVDDICAIPLPYVCIRETFRH
ncbi:low affinity immunoglobulin epsilon Fc receptor-like isoform X2 [Syngnathus typhle]|uniref:low affinity immunoglobulin epsilon Fc receptor-like isoform X2 n=1 Tax=Syngnathus typhle TaxID=161592 RepID=UPI002A69B71C|nr:low affinity immunoglobulin epsilon Fc receptor-like isoform X2 [Syngnathus typhle]